MGRRGRLWNSSLWQQRTTSWTGLKLLKNSCACLNIGERAGRKTQRFNLTVQRPEAVATSQLVLLISTTATNVSSWLNGIRHLDKSLLCGMGPSLGWSNGEDAIALPCPIGSHDIVPPGSSRRLAYPKVIDPAVPPLRPERHIPNSIATMRRRLIAALVRTLPRCPCCSAPMTRHQRRKNF